MNNNKIGIFDSGIGGVTVLKEIIKILPNEDYIYYSDSINNPYGDKSDDEVFNICDNIVKKMINQNCKAIVIACNTASAKSAEALRKKYTKIPIVAIEPAYKMVYDFAYNVPTLVIATKGTIESEKFHKLYNKYNNHNTYLLACPGLADIIEQGNIDEVKNYITQNLSKYKNKVKNVVLGCTHYPLIQNELIEVLGDVQFFNGAPSVAKQLKKILLQNNLINEGTSLGKINFIDSSNSEQKKQRFFKILQLLGKNDIVST